MSSTKQYWYEGSIYQFINIFCKKILNIVIKPFHMITDGEEFQNVAPKTNASRVFMKILKFN